MIIKNPQTNRLFYWQSAPAGKINYYDFLEDRIYPFEIKNREMVLSGKSIKIPDNYKPNSTSQSIEEEITEIEDMIEVDENCNPVLYCADSFNTKIPIVFNILQIKIQQGKIYYEEKFVEDFSNDYGVFNFNEENEKNKYFYEKVVNTLDKNFPWLCIKEFVGFSKQKKSSFSMNEIFMHRDFYCDNEKYKALVDKGFAFLCKNAIYWPKMQLNNVYDLFIDRKREDFDEDVYDFIAQHIEYAKTILYLIDNYNFTYSDLECYKRYIKNFSSVAVNNFIELYDIINSVKKVSNTEVIKRIRAGMLQETDNCHYSQYVAIFTLLISVRMARQIYSVSFLSELFEKKINYNEWALYERLAFQKQKENAIENLKTQIDIRNYRDKCEIKENVMNFSNNFSVSIKIIKDSLELSQREADCLVDNFMKNFGQNDILIRLSEQISPYIKDCLFPSNVVFLKINIKTGESNIILIDNTSNNIQKCINTILKEYTQKFKSVFLNRTLCISL